MSDELMNVFFHSFCSTFTNLVSKVTYLTTLYLHTWPRHFMNVNVVRWVIFFRMNNIVYAFCHTSVTSPLIHHTYQSRRYCNRTVVSLKLWLLNPQGKRFRYLLSKGLDGLHSWSWLRSWRINPLPSRGSNSSPNTTFIRNLLSGFGDETFG
jgi:hypothetical protein